MRSSCAEQPATVTAVAHDGRRRRPADPRHRDLLRRDRDRHRPRPRAAGRTRSRRASTSMRASAASCPRWPAARTSRRSSPRCRAPAPPQASRCATSTPSRSPPARGSSEHCWWGRRPPRRCRSRSGCRVYGVNHLASHVVVDELQHGPLPDPTIGAARVRRALVAAARGRRRVRHHPARADPRRRRRGGLRQGRPPAGPAVPGGSVDRPDRRRGRPRRDRLPPRAQRPGGPRAVPLRLQLLRAQDGRRPLGARPRGGRRAGAGGRRGGVRPGGHRRRADRARLVAACATHGVEHAVIGGGVAANSRLRAARRRTGATRPASSCGCPGRRCAPTTAPWWRRWARGSCAAGCRPRRSTSPRRPRCRSPSGAW